MANMQTNYLLGQEIEIAPTPGLDGVRGLARVIGVMNCEAVPAYAVEPFLDGLNEADAADLNAETWYCFRYVDEAVHAEWAVMYLPESLLESMVQAAVRPTCSMGHENCSVDHGSVPSDDVSQYLPYGGASNG